MKTTHQQSSNRGMRQKAGLKVLYLIDVESLQDRHCGGGYT